MCSDHRSSMLSAVIDRMKTTIDRILGICAIAFERGEPCHLEILFLLLRASSFFITYLLVNFISIWLTHILKITAPFQKIVLVPKRFVQHVAVLTCQSHCHRLLLHDRRQRAYACPQLVRQSCVDVCICLWVRVWNILMVCSLQLLQHYITLRCHGSGHAHGLLVNRIQRVEISRVCRTHI